MRRILLVLAVATAMAAMMVAAAAPAMAHDRNHNNNFGAPNHNNNFGVLDDNHFDNDEEEDVDIERERFGDIQCIFVIEEEGNDEDLEDVFCFPRTGAFDAGAFDPFIG